VKPSGASLLERLQGIIERSYAMHTGIREVGKFVVGDAGYRRLYSKADILQRVSSGDAAEPLPRLLLRASGPGAEALRAVIYYPDALVRRLEAHPPTRGLDERNIDDFAAFVEELDHLLCVAQRVREGIPFSLLELELHANVTKYLAAELFLSLTRGVGWMGEAERSWLRYHLFDKRDFVEADSEVRSRYRDAARYGWRFLAGIEGLPAGRRLAALREFHHRTHHQKLAHLN